MADRGSYGRGEEYDSEEDDNDFHRKVQLQQQLIQAEQMEKVDRQKEVLGLQQQALLQQQDDDLMQKVFQQQMMSRDPPQMMAPPQHIQQVMNIPAGSGPPTSAPQPPPLMSLNTQGVIPPQTQPMIVSGPGSQGVMAPSQPQMPPGGPPPGLQMPQVMQGPPGMGGPPQGIGGPPPGIGGPPQNMGGPPGPPLGMGGPPGPPQGMGGPPGPPQGMGGPPGPPQGMGGPPGPPQGMGGPPGPPQGMGGPPGPPQGMGGPPQNMGGPPQNMGGPPGPPQMMGRPPGPPQGMGGSQGPPQRMGGPPSGPQGSNMGGPPMGMDGPPRGMDRPPQRDSGPQRMPGHMGPRGPSGGQSRQPPPLMEKNIPPPAERSGPPGQKEMKLPVALEKMLEFKTARAEELGFSLDELDKTSKDDDNEDNNDEDNDDVPEEMPDANDEQPEEEEEEEEEVIEKPQPSKKEAKNKRRKKKKKKAKKNRQLKSFDNRLSDEEEEKDEDVQVEYVQEQLELEPSDPNYFVFSRIFEAFKISEPEKIKDTSKPDAGKKDGEKKDEAKKEKTGLEDDDDDDDMPNQDDEPKISKKKLKKMTRLSVAQLKQLVTRPDVVEMQDVTARDPRLLVHLKATRNSVPVPRHWSYKRKYLQGKRGIEKQPFELPDFIKSTGIEEMRAALAEKEDQKTMKSKMRERVRPKMGKIDIDYQKLHDAFFRYQTKPKMTIHGDLYYEGKEFETRLREKKPGNISDDLRLALGMPVGGNSEKVPPPWLIAMQRYGPPPSYPNLKIPGLNAGIPENCTFGYHAGGWGKPPVDETGKPLYGDVFGTQNIDIVAPIEEDDLDKSLWGEMESESESEEESEESEEEDDTGLITPSEGLITPSGMTSIPIGVETPEMIELRKRRIEDAMDQGGDTPALYQVLPEKKQSVGGAMMGSSHGYEIPAVGKKPGEKLTAEGIEVTLNPEELDLDTAAMQAKYEQTVREQQSQLEKEDLSDMVAEHAAKQKKRKNKQSDSGKSAKKYKEFKF